MKLEKMNCTTKGVDDSLDHDDGSFQSIHLNFCLSAQELCSSQLLLQNNKFQLLRRTYGPVQRNVSKRDRLKTQMDSVCCVPSKLFGRG